MHDTIQLTQACQRDSYIAPLFQGVFAADKVPFSKLNRLGQWAIIINTDPAHRPGQHWVAAMKKNGKCYFFDSYGQAPSSYQNRLWNPLNRCSRSHKDYQQTYSTVCGDYCLFFLRLFCSPDFRPDFDHLDEYFNEHNDEDNDNLVHSVVHDWFPAILNKERHDQFLTRSIRNQSGGLGANILNQICISRE